MLHQTSMAPQSRILAMPAVSLGFYFAMLLFILSCSSSPHLIKPHSIDVDNNYLSPWANLAVKQIESCHSEHKRYSELYLSAQIAFSRISRFEANSDDLSVAEEFRNTKAKLAMGILNLWWLTGNILYPDVPYNDLEKHAPPILGLYANFIMSNGHKDHHEVISSGFESTIDAMQTEYAWHAIRFIRERCSFRPAYLTSASKFTHKAISDEDKRRYYNAYHDWHKANLNNISWNTKSNKFAQKNGLSFEVLIENRPSH